MSREQHQTTGNGLSKRIWVGEQNHCSLDGLLNLLTRFSTSFSLQICIWSFLNYFFSLCSYFFCTYHFIGVWSFYYQRLEWKVYTKERDRTRLDFGFLWLLTFLLFLCFLPFSFSICFLSIFYLTVLTGLKVWHHSLQKPPLVCCKFPKHSNLHYILTFSVSVSFNIKFVLAFSHWALGVKPFTTKTLVGLF